METQTFWRRCSNCKKEIPFGAKYSLCSVQSCTKVRAPTQFCSADCWAVHNEIENHKDAWAVEQTAPKTADAPSTPPTPKASSSTPPSSSSSPASGTHTGTHAGTSAPAVGADEVLVIVSRFKDFVKEASNGMSTSDQVIGPMSAHVKKLADLGIENAKRHDRKTMLGRDIPKPAPGGNKDEVLVVVSRLKEYVRGRADLRTSDEVPPVISEELRRLARVAIEAARKDGRKTVMGRDVPAP